jgi:hypothetical protein
LGLVVGQSKFAWADAAQTELGSLVDSCYKHYAPTELGFGVRRVNADAGSLGSFGGLWRRWFNEPAPVILNCYGCVIAGVVAVSWLGHRFMQL